MQPPNTVIVGDDELNTVSERLLQMNREAYEALARWDASEQKQTQDSRWYHLSAERRVFCRKSVKKILIRKKICKNT